MEKTKYVLEMKDIVKSFPGVKALDGVNLAVEQATVHAICGENGAGKSTLMKIINGTYEADSGEMYFNGQKVGKHTVEDTIKMGIAMIYQEMNPILEMTIAENVYLGREPKKGMFVDFRKLYADTQKLLDRLSIPYNSHQKMKEISIAGQQLVEITKAISQNATVIIMDEPTSAIADHEIDILFNQIVSLKKQGVTFIYITHKLDEIFRIADCVTIVRDGKYVDSGLTAEFTPDKIVRLMVGREISNVFPKEIVPIGDVVFEVKNLTQGKQHGGRFRDISFDLRRGEILGFAGLVGAGRSEVMRAIFGLDSLTSGDIYINGKKVAINDSYDAIQNNIAMISEDRRAYGLVLQRSVSENISLVNLAKFQKYGLLDDRKITKSANRMVDLLKIKIANLQKPVNTLSGGNQQKVVLSKWLIGDVKIMILDEPVRGIDVGTKAEIHRLMSEFAKEGMALIMISSELPEILGMSDRIVVMQEGRITKIFNREEATQENIMMYATRKDI